jgi:hypothetical protein
MVRFGQQKQLINAKIVLLHKDTQQPVKKIKQNEKLKLKRMKSRTANNSLQK